MHNKYIVAAATLSQYKEVERVCRDSTVYDPVEARDFLIAAKLPDPRALIQVCDRFGYVDELVTYLFKNGLHKFVEVYVQKVRALCVTQPSLVGCCRQPLCRCASTTTATPLRRSLAHR